MFRTEHAIEILQAADIKPSPKAIAQTIRGFRALNGDFSASHVRCDSCARPSRGLPVDQQRWARFVVDSIVDPRYRLYLCTKHASCVRWQHIWR